jgi:MFS family permease
LGARPDQAVGKRSRRGAFNGTVLALGLTSFFSDISSEMVAAVIPLYLTVGLGFSPAAFGLFQGAYELANAALRIVGGSIADRTRKPKETAATGYGLSTATRAGLLGSVWVGLPVVPFLLLDRLGKGLRTGPRDAMISLATPQAAWGTAFGIHRSMDAAGALIGPLLAFGVLLAIPGSFDSIFVLSFCFGLLGFAVITTRVRNPVVGVGPSSVGVRTRPSLREQVRNRGFRRILVLGAGFGLFTIGDSLVYLVIWNASGEASEVGTSGFGMEWFPLLFAGTAVAFLLSATPIGRLSDRVGRARVWVAGHVMLALVYVLLLRGATSTPSIVAILVLLGLYYGATDGVLPALAAAVIPEESRSSGLAVLATGVAFARMGSAAGFGLIWEWVGADGALKLALGGLCLAMVAAVAVAALGSREHPDAPNEMHP